MKSFLHKTNRNFTFKRCLKRKNIIFKPKKEKNTQFAFFSALA